ncbi:MAG TPA: hypothetical protein VKV28_12735 [Candidatus Binataceae bacterium]|nr:hypothetical protein [Candidatus Binataceae bacterium]
MGKYFQTLERLKLDPDHAPEPRVARLRPDGRNTKNLIPVGPGGVPRGVLQAQVLRTLSERLAPVAVVESATRVLVGGCERGDGASTMAAALALDLSQRLGLRTLLVDAHLRQPALHLFFRASPNNGGQPMLLDGDLQIQPTGLRGLDLAICSANLAQGREPGGMADYERRCAEYQATIVDLGVPRLDPRMLVLARVGDPILLVVRYGQTERSHLVTTVSALRAANRSMAGVILNDKTDPIGKNLRRLIPV